MSNKEMWNDVFANNAWGKYPAEPLIRFVARNFYKKTRKDVRLLEVGCGPGGNIWFMAREGFSVYGIDGSDVAIQIANNRLNEENISANLVVGDILSLPYENNFFDGIIDSECLYFNNLDKSRIMIDEIARVLKPEGMFFSRTFAEDCFKGSEYTTIRENEYDCAKQGPFANRGFFRLIDSKGIDDLYGSRFEILSKEKYIVVDESSGTKVSEWVINMKKKTF